MCRKVMSKEEREIRRKGGEQTIWGMNDMEKAKDRDSHGDSAVDD